MPRANKGTNKKYYKYYAYRECNLLVYWRAVEHGKERERYYQLWK